MRFDPDRLERVAEVMRAAVKADHYPNAVIAVGSREGLIWKQVIPGSDFVTLDSIFPLASITKPIMAIAMVQLVERGLLLLSQPVTSALPEFEQNGKAAVTFQHLLTHTSGLQENNEAQGRLFEQRAGREAYTKLAIEAGLDFEPGSQYRYSNMGYVVLAEVVSRLSGQPYPNYLRDYIFQPLGMTRTGFDPSTWKLVAPVHGYGSAENVAYFNTLAAPSGGLYSNADDLIKLGRCLLNGGRAGDYQLLSPAAIEFMTRSYTAGLYDEVNGQRLGVFTALGWGKRSDRATLLASEKAYGNAGSTGTYFWIDPHYDLIFVLLSSRWQGDRIDNFLALNAVYAALVGE